MRSNCVARCVALACLVLAAVHSSALAQQNNNGGANGVIVDAEGVLKSQSFPDPGGMLHRQRVAAAKAALGPLAGTSKLRKVSLPRLEAAIRARLDKGLPPTDEMQRLAGLTRVQFVFYYPETHDVVLAGPAEGWVVDQAGRMRGVESGRPIVELQDLLVALRAYPPSGKKANVVMCSIDPTPEGLAAVQAFLKQAGRYIQRGDTQTIVNGLRTSLGMQNIRVGGISANTHMAQVLIESDYRMKLIGIGLEKPPVKIASYVDNARPGQVSRNALQRWFFVPDYQCLRVADDKLGMELVGESVKLISEDQVVGKDGSRQVGGPVNAASQRFVETFTKKYAELAAKVPVYAQLRSAIDLLVAAAFIQQQDFCGQADWRMETLLSEQALPVETLPTPLHVEPMVNAIVRTSSLMTPIGGGVHIEPRQALSSSNLLGDEERKVDKARAQVDIKNLPAGKWWWD